ncbi:MAG: EAL domain-containing protein [Lachnospiraceae bacterium]|nr:EAL domain-containing protein [Lachnospiraceae bacterium]
MRALSRKAGIYMFKVTSSSILHRPERVLYYLQGNTEEVERYISDGVCPSLLEKYQYAFGTYDEVGIFYLPSYLQKETGMKYVVGIEYRKNDKRLNLPEHLPFVVLPACDIIMLNVAYENQLNDELLDEIICCAKDESGETWVEYRYPDDGVVTAFTAKEKLRVLYQIEKADNSKYCLSDNCDDYSKEDLYRKAYRETVTGYYNWTWMWDRLQTYYLSGVTDYGFVHFDIKDFKMVNELYNHEVANSLLRRVAQNIEAHKDWIYFGARCHNDNFAMMIRDMPEEEIKEKLTVFFDEISKLDVDPSYRIYYRCGVVNMRNAMRAANTVADCAKLAQAMGTGINVTEINFYTDDMHENLLWGKQLKAYLDTAIRADEFLVYIQPKFDIYNEHICGAEALIRWNYKHKGIIAPFRFIPYFESDDSIIKVDDVVLHKVCAKLKEWKKLGYRLHPVSVNLSRKHMEQPGLVSHLAGIVDSYGVEHSLIEFELTETAAYDNQKYMVSVMNDLKNNGFLISMDDFGTGYSSFSLLQEMPIDTLKIDKSFVDSIMVDEDSDKIRIILRHIISMAKELGIHCIAEGVEEHEQILALRDLGCEMVQGYYYSKPIPMESFEKQYLKHE